MIRFEARCRALVLAAVFVQIESAAFAKGEYYIANVNAAVYSKGFDAPEYSAIGINYWSGDNKSKPSCSLSFVNVFHTLMENPGTTTFSGLSPDEYHSYENNDEMDTLKCFLIGDNLTMNLSTGNGQRTCIFKARFDENQRATQFSGECIGNGSISPASQTYRALDKATPVNLILQK